MQPLARLAKHNEAIQSNQHEHWATLYSSLFLLLSDLELRSMGSGVRITRRTISAFD
jgi:hypothetical protein